MGRTRKYGTGAVVQMANGRWEARLWIQPRPDTDDKPRRVTRRARTKEDAEQALRALMRESAIPKSAAVLRVAGPVTVEEFLKRWRTMLALEVVRGSIREEHAHGCARRVRDYVLPVAGRKRICDVRVADVDEIVLGMHRGGHAQGSIRHVVLAFRRMLRAAVKEELVADWVPATIVLPEQKFTGVRPTPSAAQFDAVLARLGEDPHPGALLVLLAAWTGARRGEVCGARWADFDLVAGTWTVRTSLSRAEGTLYEHAPKNGTERVVPLRRSVVRALREVRRAHPFRTYLAEMPELPGEPIVPNAISYVHRRIAIEVGAPGGMHSLRRYVATRLMNATGGDLDTTADVLGLKTIDVLRRHYVADRTERKVNAMTVAFGD